MNAGGTLDLDLPIGCRPVSSKDVVGFMAYPLLQEMLIELRTDFRNVKDAALGDGALLVAQCEAIVARAFARRGVSCGE